jgi:hypothetical protein
MAMGDGWSSAHDFTDDSDLLQAQADPGPVGPPRRDEGMPAPHEAEKPVFILNFITLNFN